MHLLLGVVASANACLVGDDEQLKAPIGESLDGLAGAGDELDLFRLVEVAGLDDEGSVAVEEDGWFAVGHAVQKLARSSLGVTVAVPSLPTTIPAAWFEKIAASIGLAPAEMANVNEPITVSPAPDTSKTSRAIVGM